MNKGVHHSAFMICNYRASNAELSGDPYAHYWITPESTELTEGMLQVSSFEAIAHCQRNRFFLDQLKEFLQEHPDGVIVNIGAGFSLYPQCLQQGTRFCDVDLEAICHHKEERLATLVAEGKISKRDITYMSADLQNPAQRDRLEADLSEWIDGAPVFILIEGVLFFLNTETVDALFKLFRRLQKPDDRLGAVCFVPEIREAQVYQDLKDYMTENIGSYLTEYTALPVSFFNNLPGYHLEIAQDQGDLSYRYRPDEEGPDEDEILNEHMYVLHAIDSD